MEELLSSVNLQLIWPLLLIQGVLVVVSLFDWIKQEDQIRGNRWIWLVVIIFVNLIGPVLYFIFGRRKDS